MLQQIDMTKKMSKKEYKSRMETLIPEMSRLQRECKNKKIPVIIVFEGFGAAGKGYQIGRLIQALDPRGFSVYSIGKESQGGNGCIPSCGDFGTKTPAKGEMVIFDRKLVSKGAHRPF